MLVMNMYDCYTFSSQYKINTNDSGEKTTVKKTSNHSCVDIQHFRQVAFYFFQFIFYSIFTVLNMNNDVSVAFN